MSTDRRTLLKYGLASLAAMQASGALRGPAAQAEPADHPITIDPNPGYLRIATEEAWCAPQICDHAAGCIAYS